MLVFQNSLDCRISFFFMEHLSEWCLQKYLLDLAGPSGFTRLFC